MGKKAQVTVFIILGVILLLIAGLVIYITTQKIVKPIEEKIIVPEGTEPIYDYIAECIYQTAKQGITLMGIQGGYINIPASIAKTPASHITIDQTFKIPYWYYNKQDRTPTLEFLQSELNTYLRNRVKDCTNFASFAPQYTIRQRGDLVPKTTIAQDKVIIELIWPIEITTGTKTIYLDKITKEIDVKLKEIHDIAAKTMEFENRKSVFENITLGLVSANPEIPTNGMIIDCTPQKWYVNEIKEELQNTLKYNIPSIRIENTPYLPFDASTREYSVLEGKYEDIINILEKDKQPKFPEDTPDDAYEYFKMLLDIGIKSTDIKTGFNYRPEYGITIIPYPHEGNVLQSNRIKGATKYLGYLCINQWHFVYDIEHPVVMTLKDDNAFKGEGYVFQFAFPVLIDDNTANRQVTDRRPFVTSEYNYEFCEEMGEKTYDIRATGLLPGAMFATEMDKVNITYECFDRYCELGQTKGDGGVYRLRTSIPTGCINPFITAAKPGYLTATRQLTQDVLQIPLQKLKTMNYEIMIHEYNSLSGTYAGTRTELKDTEQLTIMLGINGTDHYQHKSYEKGGTIDLIDGTAQYELNIFLSRRDNLIGGYSRDALKITYEEMAGKDTVVFHLFEYIPIPITEENRGKLAQYMYEGEYESTLKPTFK